MSAVISARVDGGLCRFHWPVNFGEASGLVLDVVVSIAGSWTPWSIIAVRVTSDSQDNPIFYRVGSSGRSALVALPRALNEVGLHLTGFELSLSSAITGVMLLDLTSIREEMDSDYDAWGRLVDSLGRSTLVSGIAGGRESQREDRTSGIPGDASTSVVEAADRVIATVERIATDKLARSRAEHLALLVKENSPFAGAFSFVCHLEGHRDRIGGSGSGSAAPQGASTPYSCLLSNFNLREVGAPRKSIDPRHLHMLTNLFMESGRAGFGGSYYPTKVGASLEAFGGGHLRNPKGHPSEGAPDSYAYFAIHELAIACLLQAVEYQFWGMMVLQLRAAAEQYVATFRHPSYQRLSLMGANYGHLPVRPFNGNLLTVDPGTQTVPDAEEGKKLGEELDSFLTKLVNFWPM